MQTFLVALLALLLGAALTFVGYRFFRFLIPIWGFFAGFSLGAAGVTTLFGDGFLSTVTGWVVGLVVALIFAALAYFFYWGAVVILGAFVGYWLGAGLLLALGMNQGFLTWLVGVLAGAAVAVVTIFLNVPKYLLVILAAIAGASSLVAGVLLLFGQIPLAALQHGGVSATLSMSWFWWLIWVALAAVGIFYQIRSMAQYNVTVDMYRY